MRSRFIRFMMAILLVVTVWTGLVITDVILYAISDTYQALANTIDKRDINGGNALNFFGDEMSGKAVYQVKQHITHPSGAE